MSLRQFAAPRVGNGAVCIWLYAGKPVYLALLVASERTFTVTK